MPDCVTTSVLSKLLVTRNGRSMILYSTASWVSAVESLCEAEGRNGVRIERLDGRKTYLQQETLKHLAKFLDLVWNRYRLDSNGSLALKCVPMLFCLGVGYLHCPVDFLNPIVERLFDRLADRVESVNDLGLIVLRGTRRQPKIRGRHGV